MTDNAKKTVRPREATPPLVDAGYGATDVPSWEEAGLPFDPAGFAVGEALRDILAGLDSVDILNNMQAFDTRTTAAAYYERRIKDLTE